MTVVATTCPYCGVGCGVMATPDGMGGAKIEGDRHHPANRGRLCSKGAALGETLSLEDRLLYPEIDGQRVSWDAALDHVAAGLRTVIAQHGPDAVAFYVSGQLLTEDYYAANKLIKGFLGTANIDTNSRLCMASSVAGHKRAFGSDTVPGLYEDFEQADLVVLVGSNLAWCHPVLFQRLDAAKRARPRMKVVVIDPRRTETCDIADLHLALRPGSDVALFNGLLTELHQRGATAADFVAEHTAGLDAALAMASAGDAGTCGLSAADLALFFDWFAKTERTVTLYSQGVNQSTAGVDKVNAIINCHLLTGRIGRPGMGPFSITGQPNAMGGREVGALSNALAAHMDFAPADLDRVGRFWGTSRLASKPGLKAVDLFDAVGRGEIKALWIMATNPVASMPNADAVRAALAACDLSIVSEAVRASDTVDACRVRLPALAWAEKEGTVTNSERCISRQRPFLPAPGEARPDWWIIAEVARRLGYGDAFAWTGPADIFREHAALSAFENEGTRDFDIGAYATLDDAGYGCLAPFVWPAPTKAAATGGRFFGGGDFFHVDRRARFVGTPVRPPEHAPDPEHPLRLNTGRVRDQWHTMTRTGKSVRLAGHRPEPTVDLHPLDAAARNLRTGDIAELRSRWGRAVFKVHVSDAVRPGDIFAPMHWTAQLSRSSKVNAAVNPAVDRLSGQPELKHTPVQVLKLPVCWHGTILARRPIMVPEVSYGARVRVAGCHAYVMAGEQSLEQAKRLLSVAVRATNPGPWVDGAKGIGAVIADGVVDAVLALSEDHDEAARDRLSPFLSMGRLTADQRAALLEGGGADDRGGEICACFGVSRAAIEAAIGAGALSLAEIGAETHAGTNCGSCRPEIRALLRGVKSRKAA
ncbi:assimilatory nitrate reductase (NADH) alpha subunit apoprotein [Enhydrobacter aerosaccus]|uniref:Assimilatory nitrate reductase (NADH) alpha subunit apoprotein n=1 Tax=Enhydrobacter aerosaccus TaxID=225324 RepID=A0A1T4QGI6_9HYPH|nr:nitrate reductase [Enhydrobacter aerosaccus]SKA02398.1 assimilatory nitrate reductase (NADH) alpha subunit apoprotein [Enhydrobacter aerosaccus]